MIINQKWRRSLQDVRARRGADVESEHVVVVATLSLKLRQAKTEEKRREEKRREEKRRGDETRGEERRG